MAAIGVGRAAVRGADCGVRRRSSGRRPQRRENRILAAGAFDAALLLPNSFRSAWVARRGGIAETLGLCAAAPHWLLTRAVARPSRPACISLCYYRDLVRGLGFAVADSLSAHHASGRKPTGRADDTLRQNGVTTRTGSSASRRAPRTVTRSDGRQSASPRWSRALARRGATCVLVGAAGDRDAAREIESSLPPTCTRRRSHRPDRPAAARGRSGALRRVRLQRFGRDAPGGGARRAGDRDLRADRRTGHGAARRPRRAHAPGVLPPVHAARLPDRSPLHEGHHAGRRLRRGCGTARRQAGERSKTQC